jgi:hypothetical protein
VLPSSGCAVKVLDTWCVRYTPPPPQTAVWPRRESVARDASVTQSSNERVHAPCDHIFDRHQFQHHHFSFKKVEMGFILNPHAQPLEHAMAVTSNHPCWPITTQCMMHVHVLSGTMH